MSYTLNKTDGNELVTIADTNANSDYGIVFFGRNYDGWGESLNENFVKLLENFANSSAPDTSVKGQLWYDSSANILKIYNGSAYVNIPLFEISSSAPTGIQGKFWLDSDDNRLYIHNGTAFKAVTPGTITFTGDVTGSGTMNATTGAYNIALTSAAAATNSFTTIAVSGQSNVVADSGSDTLTLAAGTGMVITTDASADSVTLAVDTSSVLTNSNTITVGGTKTFTGTLKATGTIELGGSTKGIFADLSPGTNTGIRWNSGSSYWELTNDGSNYYQITTGTKAPNTASYVTLATDSTLTQERVLTAGTGISITDAGAGSTVTVANTGVTSAIAGTGIGVSGATGAVTITNNGVTSYNGSTGAITNYAFGTVAVSGQSNVVADSGSDTLTLVAGTGISITTNASTDAVTINSTVSDTNTTYGISSETNASGAALRLTGSDSTTDDVVFASGTGITVSRTDANTITIATSGSSGITSAYTTISDGTNTATASGTDTIKFRGGTGVTATVGSNDVTHGDNVLISVQDASTSQKGIVQLSDSSASTSTSLAATANLANTKLAKSGGTLTGALTVSDSTVASSTSTGAIIVTGGVGVGGRVYATDLTVTNTISGSVTNGALTTGKLSQFAATTSAELAGVISDETGSGALVFAASPTFTGTANFAAISTSGNVTVGGNLTINGTTTTVNSTTTTLDDPIITLGGDTAPSTDDNKDRGVEFRWHNGSAAKVGFFGYDDSTGRFSFIPDATNSSEVFSGTVGDAEFTTVYANLTGNVTGNLTGTPTVPSITKSGTNGVGDIGQSGNTFATVYATTFSGVSTTAKYADLAERYEADAFYEPGTVLVVGGTKEVTACTSYGAENLAGVVSTKPAYLMNTDAGSDITHPAIALKGRVPCKVYGPVKKGQLLTTSSYAGHAEAVKDPVGIAVVGIALEDNAEGAAVIEIMVK